MRSRKLQRSKSGSFLLTLPKSWVKEKKLEKGERVDIAEEEDGSLRIVPPMEKSHNENKTELKVEDFPNLSSLENMVKASYMQGAEKIEVFSEKGTITEEKSRLRDILPELIASEVTQDRPSRFTIKVLADPRSFSIEDLLERISELIHSIQKDAAKALKENNPELASDAQYRGIDIDRLHRLTMRQLSLSMDNRRIADSIGIKNQMECLLYAVSFRDLCRMGYHVKRAAGIVGNLKIDIEDKFVKILLDMSKRFLNMQKNVTEALRKKDHILANEVVADMEKIKGYDEEITNKIMSESLSQKKSYTLNSLSTNWRRAAGHAVGVADIAISFSACRLKKRK